LNPTEKIARLEELSFLDEGQGTPLLLLHGFCESNAIFSGLVPELRKSCRVIAPNMPGHAGLAWDAHIRSLDELAFWLRDLLEVLELDKIVLVGHSLGGYVATAFARHFPERLLGLGLMHSTALADADERKENRTKAMEFIATHGHEAFLQVFVKSLFHDPEIGWLQSLNEITRQTDPEAIMSLTRIMRDRPDQHQVVKELQVPLMYITGEKDGLVKMERSREELQDLPFAVLKRIPEASHMGMYEAPEKVIDAVLSLVDMV
jgi:pimeloyl-ACP methyl ester carboxylesterase